MAKKRTSPSVAAKASKVLTSTTTTPDEKSVAASALAQAEADSSGEIEQLRADLAAAQEEAEKWRVLYEGTQATEPDADLADENTRLTAEVARLGDELAKQQAWREGARRR